MPTEPNREELIRQLLKLLDQLEFDVEAATHGPAAIYIRTKIAIAKDMVRKLAEPTKPDGGDGHEAA